MACPLSSAPVLLAQGAEKPGEPIVRPDIDWIPSYKVYRDRVERLAALYPDRPTTVPEGWPAQIDAERVWSGSDFKSEDDYILNFSPEDIAEIEAGLAHFKSIIIPFLCLFRNSKISLMGNISNPWTSSVTM